MENVKHVKHENVIVIENMHIDALSHKIEHVRYSFFFKDMRNHRF